MDTDVLGWVFKAPRGIGLAKLEIKAAKQFSELLASL
jgi:hypothetical protein